MGPHIPGMRSSLSLPPTVRRPRAMAAPVPRFCTTSLELTDDRGERAFSLRWMSVRADAEHDYVAQWAVYEDRSTGRALSLQQRLQADAAAAARQRGAGEVPLQGCVADAGSRLAWDLSAPAADGAAWCIDNPLSCVGFRLPAAGQR